MYPINFYCVRLSKLSKKMRNIVMEMISVAIFFFIPLVLSDDNVPVPSNKSEINSWFQSNVMGYSQRKGTLDPALETAEPNAKIIQIRSDGSGEFKTINDAIESIPDGNTNRVVISLGPGNYTEKIKIERTKPFITLYADPKNVTYLVFDGTAAEYGTVDSATLIVEADYFSAVNLIFVNSAPRPDGERKGAQAAAVRIGGDKASFYNCKFHGFQDTLCDDKGLHLFKDCYIEGTVDFIFGNGKSIYLNTELNVLPGDRMAIITAQARHNQYEDTGYAFVHCKIKGTGGIAFLGRPWMPYSRVVFSYTDMSDAVNPQGWFYNFKPETEKTVFFGEFRNTGAGAQMDRRVWFTKKLTYADVEPFLSLSFIQASKWLLPQPVF